MHVWVGTVDEWPRVVCDLRAVGVERWGMSRDSILSLRTQLLQGSGPRKYRAPSSHLALGITKQCVHALSASAELPCS